jgi:hypothetical protein
LGRGEGRDFSEVIEQVLGLGSVTREKFFTILEMMSRKNLSSYEFLKLSDIIAKQQQSQS